MRLIKIDVVLLTKTQYFSFKNKTTVIKKASTSKYSIDGYYYLNFYFSGNQNFSIIKKTTSPDQVELILVILE